MPNEIDTSPQLTYTSVLRAHDQAVESTLVHQITDPADPDVGAIVSPVYGIPDPAGIWGFLTSLSYGYLAEGSAWYRSEDLLERLVRAASWLRRRGQRSSGLIDLYTANPDSSPDAAFAIQSIVPIMNFLKPVADENGGKAAELFGLLEEFIRTAGPATAEGGFHTPNHRWVICSALSQAQALFSDLDFSSTIESYLAEEIDLNDDGQFIEKSAGGYDAIVDRSLRFMAKYLDNFDLLRPARKNLKLNLYLMHPDGTIVTTMSRRQDQGTRVVPLMLADSYYYHGRMDGNVRFLSMADELWTASGKSGGTGWLLHNFLENPEWIEDPVPRGVRPETTYRKTFPAAGIWRQRQENVSITALRGNRFALSARHGAVDLVGLRISACYHGTGRFSAEVMSEIENGIRLEDSGANHIYRRPAYEMPLGRQVLYDDWDEAQKERDQRKMEPLHYTLDITEAENGVDLHLTTDGGIDMINVQIELCFTPGGVLMMEGGMVSGVADSEALLASGHAVYMVGSDACVFGPGQGDHDQWRVREAEATPGLFHVGINLLTPIDWRGQIRLGPYTAVTRGIWTESKAQ